MEIKAKELQQFRPIIRYPNGDDITLARLGQELTIAAREIELPVMIESEDVSYGLLQGSEPCLVLTHPDHQYDYLKFCVQIRMQGSNALVSVHTFGNSRQLKKEAIANERTGAGAALLFGGVVGAGYAIGAGLRKMANAVGKSRSSLEIERLWYAQISEIFDKIII